jgi:hypothetical protein
MEIKGTYKGKQIDEAHDWQPGNDDRWYLAVVGEPGHDSHASGYLGQETTNLTVPITEQQYDLLTAQIAKWQPNVTTYSFFLQSCKDFASDMASTIGLNTPPYGLIDPVDWMYVLQAMNPQYVTLGTKTIPTIHAIATIRAQVKAHLSTWRADQSQAALAFDDESIAGAQVLQSIVQKTAIEEAKIRTDVAAHQQTASILLDNAKSTRAQAAYSAYSAEFNQVVKSEQQHVGGISAPIGVSGSNITLPECVAEACVSTQIPNYTPKNRLLRPPVNDAQTIALAESIGLKGVAFSNVGQMPTLEISNAQRAGAPVTAPVLLLEGGAAPESTPAFTTSMLGIHLSSDQDVSVESIGGEASVFSSPIASARRTINDDALMAIKKDPALPSKFLYSFRGRNMYLDLGNLFAQAASGSHPIYLVRVNGRIQNIIITDYRTYNEATKKVTLRADMVSGVGSASEYGYTLCAGVAPFDYVITSLDRYAEGGGRSCDHKTECGLSIDKNGNACAIFNVQGEDGGPMGKDTTTTTHGHLDVTFGVKFTADPTLVVPTGAGSPPSS